MCSKERHFSQLFAAIGHFSPLQISLDIQRVLFNLVLWSVMLFESHLKLQRYIYGALFLRTDIFRNYFYILFHLWCKTSVTFLKVSKEVKRGHGMIEISHGSTRGQVKLFYRCRTFDVKRT